MVIILRINVNTYIINKPCINLTNCTHIHIIIEVNLPANLSSKFNFYFIFLSLVKFMKCLLARIFLSLPRKKRTGLWIIQIFKKSLRTVDVKLSGRRQTRNPIISLSIRLSRIPQVNILGSILRISWGP